MAKSTKSPQCGLIAKKWGPCFWLHMHLTAAGYPVDAKIPATRRNAYKRYFKDLGSVLPCGKCRTHYNKIIARHVKSGRYDRAFKDRQSLQTFIFVVHNQINARLKKPLQKSTILRRYNVERIETDFRASC